MKNADLLKIAKTYGDPVYVYDASKIISQYKRLTNAFSGVKNLTLNYAAKALSNMAILKLMNSLGSGLDTVSIQEVQLGLLAGFKPEAIIFTPNGVSLEEIEEAAKLGVRINIDNLSILEQFGSKHPDIPVCIRINPHVMAGGNSNISVAVSKLPYKEGDIETNVEELGKKLSSRFNEFCKEYGRELTLAFEPGKFLVSEAGFFLAKDISVRQILSLVIVRINEISEGDILSFKNAGAYCFTMASNYNSRFRPPEVLWHEGKAILIREREDFDDLIRNQVDVKDLFARKKEKAAAK
ncbi:Diaminopimelate decarboxylase [Nymphon striatum]|nr:Diaminopimelate decarboxylase [Nymphon striatum]